MQYVYIITNKKNGTLYTGTTRDLERRIKMHKVKEVEGFSKRYNLTKLVYYEQYETIVEGIRREKQLKNYHRNWKINLIEKNNPEWKDLSEEWF